MVDGTGVHHPIGIGTNGISARALRSNNGQSDGLLFFTGFVFSLLGESFSGATSTVWLLFESYIDDDAQGIQIQLK